MARNHKINLEIIEIFNNLLKEKNLLLACTDEDLVIMLNDELFVEHRISYRTFQRYKRRALKQVAIPDADPIYLDLYYAIRKAYVRLRQQLLTAITEGNGRTNRYQWILERKFKEWNLRWTAPNDDFADDELEEDLNAPIIETEHQYPTIVGDYHDKGHPERPKDIMPVHFAVFNNYVLPNPDYDGEPDDNTREIAAMWELKQQMDRERAEDLRRWAEEDRIALEKAQAKAQAEAQAAPAIELAPKAPKYTELPLDSPEREANISEQMRLKRRMHDKINANANTKRRKAFDEEATDEDEFVPYCLD